uniref:Uncharacterized protein n=1 Tax=Glossina brevipalpis TaxID=37001 RepID=A0A1A9WXY5_9MUSC
MFRLNAWIQYYFAVDLMKISILLVYIQVSVKALTLGCHFSRLIYAKIYAAPFRGRTLRNLRIQQEALVSDHLFIARGRTFRKNIEKWILNQNSSQLFSQHYLQDFRSLCLIDKRTL